MTVALRGRQEEGGGGGGGRVFMVMSRCGFDNPDHLLVIAYGGVV